MIRFLSISHLAVIDKLELDFAPGLNVLTGETGAGKSILVGAVGLLVGGRARLFSRNPTGPKSSCDAKCRRRAGAVRSSMARL